MVLEAFKRRATRRLNDYKSSQRDWIPLCRQNRSLGLHSEKSYIRERTHMVPLKRRTATGLLWHAIGRVEQLFCRRPQEHFDYRLRFSGGKTINSASPGL